MKWSPTDRRPGGWRFDADVRRSVSRWGFAVVIVASALAMGSVHTTVLCLVAGVLGIVIALGWWDARSSGPVRRAASMVMVTALVLLGWTFVQQVPLPIDVLAAVAPPNADVWSRALLPLKESGPAWAPISLDPIATRVHLLRGVVLLLAFVGALRIAARSGGVKFLERVVLASAAVVGVAAVLHPALGAERVFGVFQPESANFGTRVAPLLNANHLAAYLNLGACVALAWALSRRSRVHRAVPFAIYLLLVGTQIIVASRGGVIATLLGTALVLWLARRRAPERPPVPWYALAGGGVAVVLVGAFVLGLRELSVSELTSDDTVKLSIIRQSLGTLSTFRWVGMGRGAFESVFPAFRSDGEGNIAFTHPENIVVQWCAEWGLPVGIAALVVLLVALRPATALARSSVPIGASAGLLSAVAHNLVDFSAEIPGVAIALATLAACITGGAADVPAGASPPIWWVRPRWTGLAAVLAAFAAIAMVVPGLGRELRQERVALRELALQPSTGREAFVASARAMILRHPAEPYLPLMGAVRAARVGDESPIPWIARTLERASVYGRAHLLLARVLSSRSPAQARLEYRLAMEQDYNLVDAAVREGAQLVRDPADAMQLVPSERLAEPVLIKLADALRRPRPAAAELLDAELARRSPGLPIVARLAASKALAALRADDGRCLGERAACVAEAHAAAQRLRDVAPTECASHVLASEIREVTDTPSAAFDELDRAMDVVVDRGPCLRRLVELARKAGDDQRLSTALERLVGAACAAETECVDNLLFAAGVEADRKNFRRGMSHAKTARLRAPQRVDALATFARLASQSGAHLEAVEAYRELASREPGNPEWAASRAREEAALDRARGRALGLPAP